MENDDNYNEERRHSMRRHPSSRFNLDNVPVDSEEFDDIIIRTIDRYKRSINPAGGIGK